jgi:hypothetical protein
MQPNHFSPRHTSSFSSQSNESTTGNRGLKRPNPSALEQPPPAPEMSARATRQSAENACLELERAIGHGKLVALLPQPTQLQLTQLLASGGLRLVMPQNNSVGMEPSWLVIAPIHQPIWQR